MSDTFGTLADLMAHRDTVNSALAEGFIAQDVEDTEAPPTETEATTQTTEETDDAGEASDKVGTLSDDVIDRLLADSIDRPLPRPRQAPDEVEEDLSTEAGRRGPTKWNPDTPASLFEEAVRYGGDRPRSVREAARRRANRPVRFD